MPAGGLAGRSDHGAAVLARAGGLAVRGRGPAGPPCAARLCRAGPETSRSAGDSCARDRGPGLPARCRELFAVPLLAAAPAETPRGWCVPTGYGSTATGPLRQTSRIGPRWRWPQPCLARMCAAHRRPDLAAFRPAARRPAKVDSRRQWPSVIGQLATDGQAAGSSRLFPPAAAHGQPQRPGSMRSAARRGGRPCGPQPWPG